jgi:hypothetical protein
MKNYNIAQTAPLWATVQLLSYVWHNDLESQYSDIEINTNQYSGNIYAFCECWQYCLVARVGMETPEKWYNLPYGGEEFSENSYKDISYFELCEEDQEAFISFLEDINSPDSLQLMEELEAQQEAQEEEEVK